MVMEADIVQALRSIEDPDLHRDIVSLGFVKDLRIDGGRVTFTIELTTPACPVKEHFRTLATQCVLALPGVTDVAVQFTANVRASARSQPTPLLPDVKNIIAIASGKGGVGKSTLTANLACAMAQSGAMVGVLDADIYGPSLPKMLGALHPTLSVDAQNRLIPLELHGMKVFSLGFMVTDDTPVIWRGPMVHNVLNQLLGQVAWGVLDYFFIDLPPGTGDAQLTITQSVPLTGAVIITTPQEVSIQIASKGLKMFQEVQVPVLGFVENMSAFCCPHCHRESAIFRQGGTERAAQIHHVPFLGAIPIDPMVALDCDAGEPIVFAHPDSEAAKAYQAIAGRVAAALSTRQMETAEAAG
ncbi:MAG: Mrp/NBP35 family ATP-binding protein [Deltaproteobacteria bacterium]|nr:Mrp/NBP35 family ATP-binding protein [Deltaproteobacteria bacterium]